MKKRKKNIWNNPDIFTTLEKDEKLQTETSKIAKYGCEKKKTP
jgi:hypothetical protein